MRTSQTQHHLQPLLSLCFRRPPTYLRLLQEFSHSSFPTPPPLVPCPSCKPIHPAPQPSLPATHQTSLCTSASSEHWPTPAQLSPAQTAPRGLTRYYSSRLQISSQRRGVTRGTLFLSPLNLSGFQKMTTLTWKRRCGSFSLRGLRGSLIWSLAAGGA